MKIEGLVLKNVMKADLYQNMTSVLSNISHKVPVDFTGVHKYYLKNQIIILSFHQVDQLSGKMEDHLEVSHKPDGRERQGVSFI